MPSSSISECFGVISLAVQCVIKSYKLLLRVKSCKLRK